METAGHGTDTERTQAATDVVSLLEHAQSLVDSGNYQAALRVADSLMETGDAAGPAWGIRALCYYRQGALDQAEHTVD